MAVARRTAITVEAIQKLVPYLWGKPRIASLLKSYTDEIQELEDAIFSVIDGRLLDSATGVTLQTLGNIVGQPDYGYDDVTYRALIRARIRANQSHGEISDIRDVLALLVPGATYHLTDGLSSGSIYLRWLDADISVLPRAVRLILKDTRAGGVRIELRQAFDANVFTFSHAGDTPNPAIGWNSGTWLHLEHI